MALLLLPAPASIPASVHASGKCFMTLQAKCIGAPRHRSQELVAEFYIVEIRAAYKAFKCLFD